MKTKWTLADTSFVCCIQNKSMITEAKVIDVIFMIHTLCVVYYRNHKGSKRPDTKKRMMLNNIAIASTQKAHVAFLNE